MEMTGIRKVVLSICTCLILFSGKGQSDEPNLYEVYQDSSLSSEKRLKAIGDLAWKFTKIDTDSSIYYANLELKLAEQSMPQNDSIGLYFTGDAYNTLGVSYKNRGEYTEAIDYYHKGLDVKTKMNNYKGIVISHINIGNIHSKLKNNELALKHYNISKSICDSIDFERGYVSVCTNIGIIYKNLKKYDEAIAIYKDALQKDKSDEKAVIYSNIGNLYNELQQRDSALYYFNKGYLLLSKTDDWKNLAILCLDISAYYQANGQHDKAIQFGNEALECALKTKARLTLTSTYEVLYKSWKAKGNDRKSLVYLEKFKLLQDSLFNEKNTKEITEKELRFDFLKEKIKDSLTFAKEKEIKDLEIVRQQEILEKDEIQRYYLVAIILLIIVFALFVLRRLQITKRQKEVIGAQKLQIEEKHNEIQESINYAKRIQTAILPPQSMIEAHLPDNFFYYQPKDVVAGDFYWLEITSDFVFLAAADCTGHGVPGAMVSVVCHNALNRAVREFGLVHPADILDKTRMLVLRTFEKSEEQMKDGMDISIIRLEKGSKMVEWAGANNPVYIKRTGTEEFEIIKGDREPIGFVHQPTPFTNHSIQLQSGDIIYLFTDGFADQFGGPDGKKYGYKQFRNLLLEIHSKPMNDQKETLRNELKRWIDTGEDSQIDDVCVIGVRL